LSGEEFHAAIFVAEGGDEGVGLIDRAVVTEDLECLSADFCVRFISSQCEPRNSVWNFICELP
jgi:hypothetical protein